MLGIDARKRAVLAIILGSYLLIVLDVSIVITGLPRIQRELGFSAAALSWVTNAYALAFGGLLLLGARAGDLYGRRRMFLSGLGLFTGASLLVGAAPSAQALLAGRALQGVGAAVLAPATLALLTTHFGEGTERNRAMGYYAAIAGVGASLGLVLGGLFADWLSWRAGFYINLPIGLALAFAARRHLQESGRHGGELDLASAASSTFGMGALVFGLVRAAEQGWQDRIALASLAIGPALLLLLVWQEARAPHPILPLRLFASGERARAYGARVLFLGGMGGFWFFTTQFLQGVLGLRPALAGLAFLPATVPNFLSALSTARLTRRHGNTRVLVMGIAIAVLGAAWLARVDEHSTYFADVAFPMVLIGIGQGLSLGPLTVAAMRGVDARDAGAASGVVNAAHQLGLALGLAILVVVFAAASPASGFAGGISAALAGTMAALALAGVLAAISARRLRP